LVIIANIIAWPVAFFVMKKWLQNFAYRIDINVWMFILAAAVALFITFITGCAYISVKPDYGNEFLTHPQ
jgi:putative ABC transport system permease protein